MKRATYTMSQLISLERAYKLRDLWKWMQPICHRSTIVLRTSIFRIQYKTSGASWCSCGRTCKTSTLVWRLWETIYQSTKHHSLLPRTQFKGMPFLLMPIKISASSPSLGMRNHLSWVKAWAGGLTVRLGAALSLVNYWLSPCLIIYNYDFIWNG